MLLCFRHIQDNALTGTIPSSIGSVGACYWLFVPPLLLMLFASIPLPLHRLC